MPRFKTLLFDLDGTLIDSRADLVSAVNFALKAVEHPALEAEQILPNVGLGLRHLLTSTLQNPPDEVLSKAVVAFDAYYADHCVDETILYPDVFDSLRHFAGECRMAVVSNKPEVYVRKIVERLGVGDFLGELLGGDSVSEMKPSAMPILEAMRRLNGTLEKTIVVGDTGVDIQSGQAAGVTTCVVRYGFGFKPEFLKLKPEFSINGFKELKEIVHDTVE